ncbi:fused FliR family export protein/FlhB family type III secretion system protein [Haloimpatiens sp. FM7330]|uniref:fused FliR family export protein/FlhB family type III secretion system protein n=1 Tax=Haloimpatiens sp. FM7330 TaxID=3298610 RepID=UPI003642F974
MIDIVYFTAIIFVFLRIMSMFIAAPVFFPKGTPKMVVIAFCLILSFILMPGIKYSNISNINNGAYFFMCCINEIFTGLILGYIIKFCFFAVQMAGQFIDMQIGFAMMNMFDPQSGSNVTVLGRAMYWISLVLFFIVDGHHMLIKTLIESFNTVNLGNLILNQQSSMLVIQSFVSFFTIGLKIALPILLVIIITDLTLGLVGRTVPQLNIMILGLPIKIVIGLLCVSLALPMTFDFIISSFDKLPHMFRQIFKLAPVLIVFASEDKTEEATPKKKRDARKKGQIAKSKELGLTLTLLASTLIILVLGEYVVKNLSSNMIAFLNTYMNTHIDSNSLRSIMVTVILRMALVILPVAVPIMIFGIAANLLQTRFLFTTETLKPDIKKLNPISGFKKIFSTRTLVELVKDLILINIVGFIGYKFLMKNYGYILKLGNLRINALFGEINNLFVEIFFKITLIMLVISLADYIYQIYQHNKDLKMSKQEVKEEFKQDEGDPQIKSKIKQKQREMASKRMMESVPDATVVITNPTHISVALKYDEMQSSAPVVVAKGQDNVALKIKEIAKENEVPIIENKPLARLMYKEVDIDSEIPMEMYEAVAEILAIVFKLKTKR